MMQRALESAAFESKGEISRLGRKNAKTGAIITFWARCAKSPTQLKKGGTRPQPAKRAAFAAEEIETWRRRPPFLLAAAWCRLDLLSFRFLKLRHP